MQLVNTYVPYTGIVRHALYPFHIWAQTLQIPLHPTFKEALFVASPGLLAEVNKTRNENT
jgi:hypothetical protein